VPSHVEDSTQTNVAGADYLIPFRKKGVNPIPVTHPVGLLEYAGFREMPSDRLPYRGWKGDQTKNLYSHWIWRQYASSIWDDIRINRTVQSLFEPEFETSRDDKDDRHMHPLQLDVVERCCVLWSNPGETILSPFMGVGTEPAAAIVNGRRALGIELKPSYYKAAKSILAKAAEHGWGKASDQAEFEFDEETETATMD
jgi:DNA methylase